MAKYFANIYDTVNTLWKGMRITWRHMINIKRDNVTLQYPEERWPQPERNIGFEHADYNVIRSRLHVDIDDCIGCLKCEQNAFLWWVAPTTRNTISTMNFLNLTEMI